MVSKSFFYVQPQFGEDSQFDYQFSNGLKPPPWILTYIHIPMVSVYCLEGQRCMSKLLAHEGETSWKNASGARCACLKTA